MGEGEYVVQRSSAIIRAGDGAHLLEPADDAKRPKAYVKEDLKLPTDVGLFEKISKQLAALKLDGYTKPVLDLTQSDSNAYVIIISDNIFFQPGNAELSDEAKTKLSAIAKALEPLKNKIIVEAYSSMLSDTTNSLTASWQLTSQRGLNVIEYMLSQAQINPRRFVLSSYGQWGRLVTTKKLAMTGQGEWVTIVDPEIPENRKDRVVISIRYPAEPE